MHWAQDERLCCTRASGRSLPLVTRSVFELGRVDPTHQESGGLDAGLKVGEDPPVMILYVSLK
jgi:hypothetical protein